MSAPPPSPRSCCREGRIQWSNAVPAAVSAIPAVLLDGFAPAQSGAAVQLFPFHIDEETPRLVIADSAPHRACARGIGSEPCLAALRRQREQAVPHRGQNIGFDVITEPAKAPRQSA